MAVASVCSLDPAEGISCFLLHMRENRNSRCGTLSADHPVICPRRPQVAFPCRFAANGRTPYRPFHKFVSRPRQWLRRQGSRSCLTSETALQTALAGVEPGALARPGFTQKNPRHSGMIESSQCRQHDLGVEQALFDGPLRCVFTPNGWKAPFPINSNDLYLHRMIPPNPTFSTVAPSPEAIGRRTGFLR